MNRKKHVLTIVVLVAVIIVTLVALSSCDLFGNSAEEEKDLKVELYSVSQSSDFAVDNEKKTVDFAVSVTSEKFSLSRISFRNNSEIVFKAYSDKGLTKEIDKEVTLSEGENVFYIQAWHKDAPSEKVTYTVTVTKPVAHVHAFGQWTVVTEATCTENGLQERVCECGEKESEVVEAKGHTFGEWTTTVEPTCADGEKKRVCSVCGRLETEVIPAMGEHNFGEWTTTVEPTCVDGEKQRECVVCHQFETEIIQATDEHTFGEWVTTVEPTCEDGEKEKVCSVCGYVKTEIIPASGEHVFGEWSIITSATCTEDGQEKRACGVCGEEEFRSIDALGHDYDEGVVTQEPTCNEAGVKTFTCQREGCGHAYTEVIPAISEHVFGEWTVATPATCTEEGQEKRTCEVCGEEEFRSVDVLGHDYDEGIVTTEPTCIEGGVKTFTCQRSGCGHSYTEVVPAKGHTFGEWTVVTSATCTEEGQEKRTCEVCGEEEFRSVDALGHDYDEGVVTKEPTCTDAGVKTFTCQRNGCGHTYTEVIEAKGHTFVGGICEICGTELNYTEGLSYELNEEGTGYTVTGIGTATDTDIVIPSEYDGLPVTSIGDYAFSECTSLTSIFIPDGVTSIGDAVFVYCPSLTSISVDENNSTYASIDGNLYNKDKTMLIQYATGKTATEFTIPNGVTSIGMAAFNYCISLIRINIPDGVTSIGKGVFFGCTSLISIIIPDSVTSIGNGAFYCCTSLISINIPDGVTSIEEEAFSECTSLTSIFIPDSVTSIGYSAFAYCTSLTSITVDENNTAYASIDGNLYNKDKTTLIQYAIGKTATEFTIPDSVTSIGEQAFESCDSLTSVTIGNSVTSIGDSAFFGCGSLTDVYYGGTEEQWNDISIGRYNENLTSANIHFSADPDDGQDPSEPEANPTEGLDYDLNKEGTEYTVTGIGTATDTDIVIPSEYNDLPVTSIGDWAFHSCTSLTSVIIPDSVTSIGDNAFYCCTSLISINIPDGVTSIGDYAFALCTSLTSIDIPDSVTSIGNGAFISCTSLTSVNIGNGVTSIGMAAFSGCTSLTSIDIPDSVTSIGYSAFAACTSLTSISVDENNTAYASIDGNLYNKDKTTLIQYAIGKTATEFTIPDSVTSIGDGAFNSCDSLTSIIIPDSVTNIGEAVFVYCPSLTSISVDENNSTYASIDGNLYNKDKTMLIQYATGKTATEFTVPDSVTSIGNAAFALCTSLTSVTIGNSVTSIGVGAFYSCTSLTSITVDENNTAYASIDGNLYNKDKTTLIQYAIGKTSTEFTIPDSVTSIGDNAFSGCTSLTSIDIPDSVTSIGDSAFAACTSLTDVYYGGTEEQWNDISIGSYNEELTSANIHFSAAEGTQAA